MNCKKCQALILTDYFDEELAEGMNKKIEAHISSCADCEEFANIARQATIAPFETLERAVPPATVWEKIREEIIEEQLKEQPNVLAKFKSLLFPKPAYVFGAMACLILLIILFNPGRKQSNVVMNDKPSVETNNLVEMRESRFDILEEVDYVASLIDENNDSEGYGTSIEEYFL